ncbi:MAG TPA: NAD(P)/FAD-dependent oxidoreductase, partial [Microthrixaceae bacterium]|nr:NAD(P)/FAD-dependent oxidoreductase [Microthrixaceae bacterium]
MSNLADDTVADTIDITDAARDEGQPGGVEHLDVLVVGAGLSGIGMACHLVREAPWASFAVFEARDDLGGTWDLFRYPGIRSDSDMFTLGYPFRPWNRKESIASGGHILEYLRETVEENHLTNL